MNVLHRLTFFVVGAASFSLAATACGAYRPTDPGQVGAPSVEAKIEPPIVATVDTVFANRPAFGVTVPDPTEERIAALATSVACRPTIVQRFASVESGISLKTLQATPGMPMLSIEPWRPSKGKIQPEFTLKSTIDGKWDTQYLKMAQAVVGYRKAILVRFAHEMNGDWYPWAMTNGNTTADFIAAWKHVVDLFRKAGATNALWVWSPNIIRGSNSTMISQFWPGEEYVDVVGLTGYGVHEPSPDETYRPTLKLVEALTGKPVLLTEVGAQADANKTQWITKFGQWLKDHPRVWGFVWYETIREGDWRFSDTKANLTAFSNSLKTARVKCGS